MSPAVLAAIESARGCGVGGEHRAWAAETVRALAYAVAAALPGGMTLAELAKQLAIGATEDATA